MNVRLEPVTIEGTENGEAMLVFWADRLVGVLVRLTEAHGAEAGAWFLEKGFGPLDRPLQPVFRDLDQVRAWVAAELVDWINARRAPRC